MWEVVQSSPSSVLIFAVLKTTDQKNLTFVMYESFFYTLE